MPLYLLPLFPLIGFVLLICFGRAFRGALGGVIGSVAVAASFVVALLLVLNLSGPTHEVLWTWLPNMAQNSNLKVGLYLDRLSAMMCLIITGIGTLIHIYSISYMRGDRRYTRFFAFLNFFVAMMLILVLADSYPLMFVGWEGVGMASYLLIGFWYSGRNSEQSAGALREASDQEGVANSNAARKAFIMNRVGDLGFMLGMFLMYKAYGTLVIPELMQQGEALAQAGRSVIELMCLFLLVGAIGKSGQLPLTTWLPDAMAGPTPVSALIHAATMVTAGVYLISRTHFLYDLAPGASLWVAWVGGLTALYGAISALNQYDIKKILAYSTVSQLGYMFMAVGLHSYTAGLFHLLTHAFFKALLFLAAGAVIHALHEQQDVREMGGLHRRMPFAHLVSLAGVLAISGIPIWSGFFSKDSILTSAYEQNLPLYLIGLLVALLTAFYMGRWYFLVWRGEYRGHAHPHESDAVINAPLGVLAALATLGGFLNIPGFLGGSQALSRWLSAAVPFEAHELAISTEWGLTIAAVAAGVLGLLGAFLLYRRQAITDVPLRELSRNSLYLDQLYDTVFNRPARGIAGGLDLMDRGVDGTVQGIGENVGAVGHVFTFWQSGFVRSYAVSMLLGTVVLVGYWAVKALGGLG
ncbi:NADH-quinone oxidoreductase subunit L [Deinococcus sonorensis]|uniref:NADH-quinone oxidoreductase subunit L n=2 Tax=Deinococcus sonorensis TaxID=309891 RepID=A0AAU7U7R3_9DEIO